MTKTLSGIEAALLEARGEGSFSLSGRKITFTHGPMQFAWSCATDRDAATQLRIFRAAPIDNRRYEAGWLEANARIRLNPQAAWLIANRYKHDWKHGRRTAVCAAAMNTPLWQEAVARVQA